MGGRCAIPVAVAVWLGLLWGARLDTVAGALALGIALPFALVAWRAPDRTGTVALLVAFALAATARGAAHRAALERARVGLDLPDALFRVSGRVVEPPQRESGEPLAVVAVIDASPPIARGARVRLRLPAGSAAEWGDRLEALASLELPPRLRNPGGFDARGAADAGSLAATGRALDDAVLSGRGFDALPRLTVARWRRAIEARFARHLTAEARELVTPLVIGDRSALSPDLNARLRASGLIHLLALSGLHVTWLAALARGASASLGAGVRARALAGGLCAVFYVGIAGPLPSLMRAAAGEGLLAAARLLDRALDPAQALAISAAVLLSLAPSWAGDLGFQLSFAATLGLVAVGPWLAARCGRWRPLAAPFLPTLSAQLTAMPLLIARFHALSWVGALANLLAVPVSGLLLTAAWLAAVVDLALPGSGRLGFDACEALAAALRAIASLAARAPGAMLGLGPECGIAVCAALGAVLLVVALPEPRDVEGGRCPVSRPRVAGAGLGASFSALALLLAVTAAPLRPQPGRWWLIALDVGQGDALAVGFEDGWWLVDAGPRTPHVDAGEMVVLPFLRWAGVRRLEALVLTHDDGDHTGGAPAVRHGVSVVRVLAPVARPGVPGPALRFGAETLARGDTLRLAPLALVRWPPRPPERGADGRRTDNAAGLVIEVGEARGRALLAADVDSTVEESLAVVPDVALLKVAHHGSASSSGASFLARARARHALLSCGRRNPFGHPDPRVVERLRAAGAAIHRTDREGALWFELSDRGARRLDWRRAEPRAVTAQPRGDRAGAALARAPAHW